METNFVLKESRIVSIDLDVKEMIELGEAKFEFTFELGINDENPKLAKVDGILEVTNNEELDSFLKLYFVGIFEGNNDNPDLKFEEIEENEMRHMLNSLVNEISPMVKQIFASSFNFTVDLTSSLKLNEEKDPSNR